MTPNKFIRESSALFYAQYILRRYQNAFASILAGIAVAKERAGRLAYLTEFLDDMKQSGELKKVHE